MITIENPVVSGWEAAIRGMRNPLNSWAKSDSLFSCNGDSCPIPGHEIGDADLDLMKRLVRSGSDHRKFMRMVVITMDITAPFYWWKEYDTYKVGTVANSCSTMHKLTEKPFSRADFSHDHFEGEPGSYAWLDNTIELLNYWRDVFNASKGKDKAAWYRMIQMLPTSYNQRRTVMLNYEVARSIYHARHAHKLEEWWGLCDALEKLPCSELITMKGGV